LIVGRDRSPSISGVVGRVVVRAPVDGSLATLLVDGVVPAQHVAENCVFSVSIGASSARATSVPDTLPESMRPTVVPIRIRGGSGLVGACWCRIRGCVCSGGQIHKGSHGLFKLSRGLGGIGTVVSGSFGG
jgi:hypothetical protein